MARGFRQLALLGLAGLPAALAAYSSTEVTCVDKASDKTVYTTAHGTVFQVLCGVDYAGGDIAAKDTDTFEACILACEGTAGCIDVSYVGSTCYMKSQLGDAITDRDWIWTAKVVASRPPLSCDNNASDGEVYQATNNDFTITCGKDYAGGDLAGLSTPTFEGCIQACDANPECLNVAYVYGACYLKKEQNPAVDSVAVWGAVRIVDSASTTTAAASTTATATTAASTTVASASASATATSTPLSCENNASNYVKYTTSKNGLYQVMCGVDYGGGDLAGVTTASFEDCIAACDDNTECIDVRSVAPKLSTSPSPCQRTNNACHSQLCGPVLLPEEVHRRAEQGWLRMDRQAAHRPRLYFRLPDRWYTYGSRLRH